MLVGRDAEYARLAGVIEEVRAGRGGALVLEGDPGIGKTVLLGYAAERAAGMTVLVARGVRSESEIPFAALLQLLRPVIDGLEGLPPRQAGALAAALALGPPVDGDRFAAYAATLTLLARAAEQRPLLAVLDDAQWLDASSTEALLFAARRLRAEAVGLLFATHPGATSAFAESGVPVLPVGGLGRAAALALLAEHAPELAPPVAEALIRATAGNPLALVEIPAILSPAQLDGSEPLEDPLPVGAGVERAFMRRIAELSDGARTALLVAAASDSPATDLIMAAIRELGSDPALLEVAEAEGLLSIDGAEVFFRHPLLRSAVYHGAAPAARRTAHRALASALVGRSDSHADERRAWHLAAAAITRDEAVAALLEDAALTARRRAGYAAAALAYVRASALSPKSGDRARRLLRAADAWQLAGRPARAIDLLDEALQSTSDPVERAAIHHLRGRIDIWRGPAASAHELLVTEAARIDELAPERAAQMLSDAVTAQIVVGSFDGAVATARRAYEAGRRIGGSAELGAALQLGKALILSGDAAAGRPLILRFRERLDEADLLAHAFELAHCAPALMSIEEYDTTRALLERLIAAGREAGAFGLLAYCLGARGELDARTGRWTTAYALAFESVHLAREARLEGQLSYNLARLARLEAAQGREDACRAHAGEALEIAHELGFGSSVMFAETALGLLELGLGDAEAATARLLDAAQLIEAAGLREPGRLEWEPDLIEACVRVGRLDEAAAALDHFEALGQRTGRASALAAAARCRGLLAAEDGFEAAFAAALSRHDATPTPFERARTQLCFGERLRRSRKRVEARAMLSGALEAFDRLGARPWAERARAELRASGQTARKRDPSTAEQLTAQELQVALLVSEGATNREAAATLFISPKTIDSHLQRVYRKLNVRSRTELARLGLTEPV